MVAVVATRELAPGNVLRRFKAESAQDEPRRGNNDTRYTQWPVFGYCCYTWASHLCVVFVFFFVVSSCVCVRARVCVCVRVCVAGS